MRLWSALQGWAGLMAFAIALYALGVQDNPDDQTLMIVSLAFGVVATLFLLVDLMLLAVAYVAHVRALRPVRTEFGKLDYNPEFQNAVDEYITAQRFITQAMTRSTARIAANNERMIKEQDLGKKQVIADSIAKDIDGVSKAIATNLPVMAEKAANMKQCGLGLIALVDVDGLAGLTQLRLATTETRQKTRELLETTKGLSRRTHWLHRLNISASVNQATRTLEGFLTEYQRTISRVDRLFAGLIRSSIVRERILSIQRLVLRKDAHESESESVSE